MVPPSTFFFCRKPLPAGAGTLQRDRRHHNGNFYLLTGRLWVDLPIGRRTHPAIRGSSIAIAIRFDAIAVRIDDEGRKVVGTVVFTQVRFPVVATAGR
jgi:hypothetical protein